MPSGESLTAIRKGKIDVGGMIQKFNRQACTSTATAPVHHRPPSAAQTSAGRKSIPNGYGHSSSSAGNSYHPSSSHSNGYGVYSVSQNGYANGNGTLSRSIGGTVRMSTRAPHSQPHTYNHGNHTATVTAQSQPVAASPRSSVARQVTTFFIHL
ncbi:hypothetical protein WR25_01947 [Diploscapter pachys]|uniref:Uncharacterized protein n=1 Tax=Diploscapter pachys TaxID=2018661 RepID=A0A2A2LHU7_9BILA|nr:hypothetical protein WR25_01947 [Diploscapter pachys]